MRQVQAYYIDLFSNNLVSVGLPLLFSAANKHGVNKTFVIQHLNKLKSDFR